MTAKEKKLVIVFIAIAVFGLLFKGIPFAYKQYQQGKMDIVDLKDKKDKITRLKNRKTFWKQEYDRSITQQNHLKQQLFISNSKELVAAKVRSLIKNLAKQSGVNIESIGLAEFKQANNWLLISLTINVRANADNVINFLNKLKANKKKLVIEKMSVYSNRNTLNGSITIAGFSKTKVTQ